MKNRFIYLLSAFVLLSVSCEDVVELDLDNADPRLVIDARIELNQDGTTTSTVLLTRTADFYTEENPVVENAEVSIIDSNNIEYIFNHVGFGKYASPNLEVAEGVAYTLNITDQGNLYTATEQLVRTSPLIEVEQETISGFDDDILKLTAFYNDPEGFGDFYLFKYEDGLNEQVDIGDDEFFDGNRAPTIFFVEDTEVGMQATFTVRGIDQRCFSFYETLLSQEGGGGNPFDAPPATVRGNIVNSSNAERFPFGYFRVSEVFTFDYTIQDMD